MLVNERATKNIDPKIEQPRVMSQYYGILQHSPLPQCIEGDNNDSLKNPYRLKYT